MNFDMGRAWNHAVELIKGSFKLQLVIAGLFILVPSAIAFLIAPEIIVPPENPGSTDIFAPTPEAELGTSLLGFVLSIVQMIGLIAILALMARSRPTVGESLGIALRSLPTLIGVVLLIVIGAIIIAIPFALVFGAGMMGLGSAGGFGSLGVTAIIIAIAALVFFFYIYTRLSMIMPVVVLGGERNVLSTIKDSWRLTGPVAWRLLGFYVLLFIAAIVISFPLGLLIGGASAIGGEAGGAVFAAMLVNLVVSAVLNIVMMGVLAAVFYQLSGTSAPDIAETFQ
ncbi:glycerophosphoryl diester phosphodiesterase membrane domain-containing protein [Alteriqipengyuania sp. WL0013]|uniref:glycerophosphoryl diester phosphodiesterase membrane domain-containing protein n=1 Tax=Alteriqipengyuania sp. WL0013 TaxID=3110773 RepID=UPI002CEFD291|nr:glycerophosphoryl diester phosphodiesterase membrane domain-containing protein [Alteriqipengyuania sp. WL0013]MEB3416719.1 glycerophosphoryl diester phosphodiesterase membrane domain-containing protein [Alteriqipengyuania sp. WL0013]